MGKNKSQQDLGRRERQIMDAVFQLGEASVADVLERLPDPPSYSAVRTMIRLVEHRRPPGIGSGAWLLADWLFCRSCRRSCPVGRYRSFPHRLRRPDRLFFLQGRRTGNRQPRACPRQHWPAARVT
jgi:hypothetical protein